MLAYSALLGRRNHACMARPEMCASALKLVYDRFRSRFIDIYLASHQSLNTSDIAVYALARSRRMSINLF